MSHNIDVTTLNGYREDSTTPWTGTKPVVLDPESSTPSLTGYGYSLYNKNNNYENTLPGGGFPPIVPDGYNYGAMFVAIAGVENLDSGKDCTTRIRIWNDGSGALLYDKTFVNKDVGQSSVYKIIGITLPNQNFRFTIDSNVDIGRSLNGINSKLILNRAFYPFESGMYFRKAKSDFSGLEPGILDSSYFYPEVYNANNNCFYLAASDERPPGI